jgi:hypothetical protein
VVRAVRKQELAELEALQLER